MTKRALQNFLIEFCQKRAHCIKIVIHCYISILCFLIFCSKMPKFKVKKLHYGRAVQNYALMLAIKLTSYTAYEAILHHFFGAHWSNISIILLYSSLIFVQFVHSLCVFVPILLASIFVRCVGQRRTLPKHPKFVIFSWTQTTMQKSLKLLVSISASMCHKNSLWHTCRQYSCPLGNSINMLAISIQQEGTRASPSVLRWHTVTWQAFSLKIPK